MLKWVIKKRLRKSARDKFRNAIGIIFLIAAVPGIVSVVVVNIVHFINVTSWTHSRKSKVRMANGLWMLRTACGMMQLSSGWCSPRGPSHLLSIVGIPLLQEVESPSVSNSQLCSAQQARKILSAHSTLIKRMPVFSICHLPFRMPNVHLTSFLIDSSHNKNRISIRLPVVLNGGTVVADAK